ncbi:MAG: hypothetical protein HY036_05465, partial [Nitrospirae bacterium]|nr:hypothetical protein [Nitrospirota bacterium]
GLGGTLLNSTPIQVTQAGGWTGSWSDTTAQVGVGYYYAVTALDCASPRHESVASTTVSVFPGGLTQDVYYDQGTSTGFNSLMMT